MSPSLKINMKNKPDYIGGQYYSKFFDAYIGAEETGEYLAALPIEERLSYIDALPEEVEFLMVLPPSELTKYYVGYIGYDPFGDDVETAALEHMYGPAPTPSPN